MQTGELLAWHLRPLSGHPPREGTERTPYLLEGFWDGERFATPVRFLGRSERDGEGYAVEILGVSVVQPRLPLLVEAARRLAEDLRYAGRLPRYALGVPAAGMAFLVYPWGAGWCAPVPDGPILEAEDLGTLRRRLADAHGLPLEAVVVWGLSPNLCWTPPLGAFRPLTAPMPWIPLMGGLEGWCVHRGEEIVRAPATLAGLWDLWETVARWGIHRDGRTGPTDLVLEIGDPLAWARVTGDLPPPRALLRFYEAGPRLRPVALSVHPWGKEWIAVAEGAPGGTIWRGADPEDLRRRVGWALREIGRLTDPAQVRVERLWQSS
jgi:hypothetical protein